MKIPLIALLLTGLFHFTCKANFRKGESGSENEKSLLWQIDKPGHQRSWVLGTIHIICKEDFIWTPAMKHALDESDVVCFELDMDDPSLMMQISMGLIDNSGKNLSDYFTPEQYSRLSKYVSDSLKSNVELFQRLKPFALQSLFMNQGMACDTPVSYEEKIMDMAIGQQKEIVGLETAADQLKLIDSFLPDSIAAYIMEVVDDPSSKWDEYDALLNYFKSQDIFALRTMIDTSGQMEGFTTQFVDDRNELWIPAIDKISSSKSGFIAVGAGHLGGEKGLINLLRQAGYEVTPVK